MGSESKNAVGLGELSPVTKKMIQNLKEIVNNCPETEIYAVLKECNMDPDDAVQRLLFQDTFHEVKSKRERRKEMKETQESRPRVNYSGSSRGIRSASERNIVWSGLLQSGYEEIGNVAHKGDNVLVAPSPSYVTAHVKGETINQQPSLNSDSINTDSRGQSIGTGDVTSTTVQPSPGCQPAWSGTSTGHLSMADIVRLGRPSSKCSQISSQTSYTYQNAITANSSDYYEKPTQVSAPIQAELHLDLHPQNASNVSGMINKSDVAVGQNAFLDGQPVVGQPTAANGTSILETSVAPDAIMYSDKSGFYGNEFKLSMNCHSESIQASDGDVTDENLTSDHIVSVSTSSGQKIAVNAVGVSDSDDSEIANGSNFFDPSYSASLTDNAVVATKLQHLSLGKEEPENNCTVVLPSHLQALAADCSHLSFGTFKSGNNSESTGLLPSNQLKEDLQEASTTVDGLSAGSLETRNIGYDANESLGSLYSTRTAIAGARNYDLPTSLQSDIMKQDVSEATLGSEFSKPSLHDNVENIERSTPELSFTRMEPKIRNTSVQHETAFLDSETRELYLAHLQSLRASDHLHAQFIVSQSIPARHSNGDSSISTPGISFSEVRKPQGSFSLSAQSTVLPQHRAHSYSQPTLPLEQPSNNMIGYSGLPQSYSHLPSTFQQAYAGSDDFLQSLADPKYSRPEYGASMSRFPGASATASYGSHGTSSNPGNYLHGAASHPMIASNGYAEVFPHQYKDSHHLTPLQQNNSPPAWNHGSGSRTLSAVQESVYYNLLGQNQQYGGYRQGQQLSPHYGALDYSGLHRSQTGMTREHQQHNYGSLTTNGAQEPLSQQLHQFWQQHH